MAKKKLPIILSEKEILKLLDQPSKTSATGLRNRAILKIMINCGLRVSEVTKLKTPEIDLVSGELWVRDGKGGKDRVVGIRPSMIELLKQWKEKRPQSLFFFPTLKGGRLGSRYLQLMTKRYAKKAGINKRVYPHSLRHFFATDYYRRTKNIEALRRILGHENIATTTIYINLENSEIIQSMKDFEGF